jgi:hypothetical protein
MCVQVILDGHLEMKLDSDLEVHRSGKPQNEWLEAFDHDQLGHKNLRCLVGEATDHHSYSLDMKS